MQRTDASLCLKAKKCYRVSLSKGRELGFLRIGGENVFILFLLTQDDVKKKKISSSSLEQL